LFQILFCCLELADFLQYFFVTIFFSMFFSRLGCASFFFSGGIDTNLYVSTVCAHRFVLICRRERERWERDGVLTSSNGYLNHEVAKKVAHVVGFGEDRVTELWSLLGKVDGDALRIVGIGAGAWGSVFIALLQDAYGVLRDSVQVGKHILHFPAFVLFSLCLSVCLCRHSKV
jgi:hypothetical protein